jgi:hypothetical protein
VLAALTGCVGESTPNVTDAAAAGACLGDVFYPGLPVEQLTRSLPVRDVTAEFVQTELGVLRGPGPCVAPAPRPLARDCPVVESRSEDTIGVMLDRSSDDLTAGEFTLGATIALTELVTGRTADGSAFQFRMSAWNGLETNVLDIVTACNGSVVERVGGIDRVAVYTGDEPHIVAFQMNECVFLIESIRGVAPDGSVARIPDTASGLLSTAAIGRIQEWWVHYASGVFDDAAAFARSTSRSRAFPASSAAASSSSRASSARPSRASSSPRTLGSRCDPRSAPSAASRSTMSSAEAGPVAIETATARLSSTTGLGAMRPSAS